MSWDVVGGTTPPPALDPEGNAVDGMTGTYCGGSGPDTDPFRPTVTTHRRTRTNASPDWWSPPSPARGVRGVVAILTERWTGKHRVRDKAGGQRSVGAGLRPSSTSGTGR